MGKSVGEATGRGKVKTKKIGRGKEVEFKETRYDTRLKRFIRDAVG